MHEWTRRAVLVAAVIAMGPCLGCNRVAFESPRENVADAEVSVSLAEDGSRPDTRANTNISTDNAQAGPRADTDLTQIGPGRDTRIYYQFIDAKGAVRFVERLEDVPDRWRARAGFVEMDSPPPLSPADARKTRDQRAGPSRTVLASTQPDVILYSANWCGYCQMAIAHLNDRGVPYTIRDVDNPAAKRELLAKTGSKGIPAMDLGGRIVKGYNKSRYDEMLASAGF